jgi:DNA adenine methylase
MKPSPIVKWAGGKGQLLAQFEPYFPRDFERYIEPFVGGGAVFFHLYRRGRLDGKRVVLIDRLEEMINVYRVIRSQVEELITELRRHEPRKTDARYFYWLRDWDRSPDYAHLSDVERAARFIFLNRTCYNGLYRVNRRGQFNVPFGRYRNPNVCNVPRLRAVSRALQGVDLRVGDFGDCLAIAERGDLVYLDPPYHPLSDTANFTSYTAGDFDIADQRRLADVYRELDRRGCRLMLSNSSTALIRELYADYELVEVQASRAISAKGDGRGAIVELLVLNRPRQRRDYSMDETLSVEEEALAAIVDYLENRPRTVAVRDVRHEPAYQAADVDLLWTVREGQDEAKTAKLEVKADRWHQTGNFFFETVSNKAKGSPGCFLYTEADYLLYYFVTPRQLYILPLPATRDWFLANQHRYAERETSTPVGQGEHYVTVGRLVPIAEVMDQVPHAETKQL